ncbi:MAG TPA: ABC transporter ATP-binding protein, partial [Candidatus Acidoferrum sp.]|nr:ABC transporter ATP-binding protein [Candidatus Acidoferrum sp.]
IGAQLAEVLRQHKMVATRAQARSRSVELLQIVGIPDAERIARSYPHQLSGGMRQRAAIALGISCDPEVLIADEPTTALDVTVQAQILELFAELQQRLNIAILLVTHDVGVAEQLAHHIAVMYAGRIVEFGPAADVLERPGHPYTAALLAALPKPGIARGELRPIKGRASLAHERTVGCPFAPRCDHASDESRRVEPDLEQIAAGRQVACVNPLVGAWR